MKSKKIALFVTLYVFEASFICSIKNDAARLVACITTLKLFIMKKTIKISMVCAALMAATSVFAETEMSDTTNIGTNDGSQVKTHNDTARFIFSRREVIINDNGIHFIKDRYNFDNDYYDNNDNNYTVRFTNCIGEGDFDPHLTTIDLGASRYGSKPLAVTLDDSVSYLELNSGFHFSIGFLETALPIVKDHLGIGIGFGLKHDCYSFSTKNLVLDKDNNGHLTHYADTSKPYVKSKLRNTYLMVPVVLEIQPTGYHGLIIQAGVEGNLRLWSKTKMKTSSGDKYKNRANLNQNLFSYNLIARVGFDDFGVFARANLSPLFNNGKGPDLYPYSAGVSFCF